MPVANCGKWGLHIPLHIPHQNPTTKNPDFATMLRTPNESFFHRNPKLLGLGKQFHKMNFGAFLANLFFGIVSPLSMSTIISTKNIYLGLGFEFEFGPQRIRDLAIVCP